jgi:uncharacterized membrane protein
MVAVREVRSTMATTGYPYPTLQHSCNCCESTNLTPMTTDTSATGTPPQSLVTVAHVVYGLHTLSLVIGALGAATVIGAFLFGWPSIIAVILNYVKRGEAQGTWLESHFRWQIRTFWFALLWAVIVGVVSALLAPVLIGFATWAIGVVALGIWAIYRIARGWLRLNDGRPIDIA